MPRIATIDVGSNAVRMLIGRFDEQGMLKILRKLRLSVRLGEDTFRDGLISSKTLGELVAVFKGFSSLHSQFGVEKVRAVATSALRNASNREEVAYVIFKESGIRLDLLSGEEEARLIHQAVLFDTGLKDSSFLLADLGGGSLEVLHSDNGQLVHVKSFEIGTVRALQWQKDAGAADADLGQLLQAYLQPLVQFVQELNPVPAIVIATGGNAKALGKLGQRIARSSSGFVLQLSQIEELIQRLTETNLEKRIKELKLRPDRADVILPAAHILKTLLSASSGRSLLLPGVGLAHGVLISLAEQMGIHVFSAADARRDQSTNETVSLDV